jgi:hypothetical protein
MYDFGFSRHFGLVRVWYLSSSEAYTNNWGLFGKENYLTFDWWKHFLKILRRSEVTINLIRRLKKNGSKWVSPLVVLYSFFSLFFFLTHLAPVFLHSLLIIYYIQRVWNDDKFMLLWTSGLFLYLLLLMVLNW